MPLTKKTTQVIKKSPTATQTELDVSPRSNTTKDNGCCMGTKTCTTKAVAIPPKATVATTKISKTKASTKKTVKTKITVKFDVGYNNFLSIRGNGANLSWETGIPMTNLKNDEWFWETELNFTKCEFKVLINDSTYESGENNLLNCGTSIEHTPVF